MRRELPSLGATTFDVRTKNEEDEKEIEEMNVKCKGIHGKLITDGDRDEMKLRQPFYAPKLEPGMKIQYAFRYTDNDLPEEETMEWCTGVVTKVSNGSNLRNPGRGPKFYKKEGAAEVKQEADPSKGEETSYSIVEIRKTLFNQYAEFGWRLYFDVEQNSKPLQAALDVE